MIYEPMDRHILPSRDTQLMPPPSQSSRSDMNRSKKIVLEEEIYIDSLEKLIERDYFPHLPALRKQFLRLERKNMDFNALKDLYHQKLHQATPAAAAADDSLSIRTLSTTDQTSTDIEIDDYTVQSFLNKFVSEDNQSYEQLQEDSLRKHKSKYHWLYENSESQLVVADGKPSMARKRAGMLMLYYIGNKVLSIEERQKMDKYLESELKVGDERQNKVQNWDFRVRNNLFFQPELNNQLSGDSNGKNVRESMGLLLEDVSGEERRKGVEKSILPTEQRQQLMQGFIMTGSDHPERQVFPIMRDRHEPSTSAPPESLSATNKKRIQPRNTSLQNALSSLIQPMLLPLEGIHTPSVFSSNNSLNSSIDPTHPSHFRSAGDYRPVAMTPTIHPDHLSSPIVTWGELSSTPMPINAITGRVLEGEKAEKIIESILRRNEEDEEEEVNNSYALRYQLPQTSKREHLAWSLDPHGKKRKLQSGRNGDHFYDRNGKMHNIRRVEDTGSYYDSVGRYSMGGNLRTHQEMTPSSVVSLSGRSAASHHTNATRATVSSNQSSMKRNLSAKEKFQRLTPAAQALAMKLNKNISGLNKNLSFRNKDFDGSK